MTSPVAEVTVKSRGFAGEGVADFLGSGLTDFVDGLEKLAAGEISEISCWAPLESVKFKLTRQTLGAIEITFTISEPALLHECSGEARTDNGYLFEFIREMRALPI